MTTSYFFAYYTLDSQVSLSSCMSIKTGLSDFLLYHYSNFWYYRSLLYYGKLKKKKKMKETTNKLRKCTLKIMKILRVASLGSSFTSSYRKKSVL